jgi:hypothetical protein
MRVIAHVSMPRGLPRPFTCIAMATKTVIVEFQGHSRIVSFQESENEMENATAVVEEVFRTVFSSPPPFFSYKYGTTLLIDIWTFPEVLLKEVQVSYLLKVYQSHTQGGGSNCTPPLPKCSPSWSSNTFPCPST